MGQVAELTFHQQTAFAHKARVQRGIVVRCQVEVIRRDQHQAGLAVAADRWRQEARLATIIDREIDVRGVEDRYVFDPQCCVGRGTETGGRVQGDVITLDFPCVAARFAGGVSAVLESNDRVLGTLGVQRAPADIGLVHHVFGVVDFGFAGIELQLGMVTDDQGAVLAKTDIAVQFATVFGLMKAGFFRLDLQATLTQYHVTGQGRDLFFLLITRGLGTDEHRRVAHLRLVIHARTDRLDVGT